MGQFHPIWGARILKIIQLGGIYIEGAPEKQNAGHTDLVDGQQVEVLDLSVSGAGLELQRKFQIEDELALWKHPVLVLVGVAGEIIKGLGVKLC